MAVHGLSLAAVSRKESESHSFLSNSLRHHGLYGPWNSPGQNTGVGSHSLLQGTFPTQGSSPGLLHCRQIVYHLSHQGSPRILEWVAYPFSSRSSWLGIELGSPALQADSLPGSDAQASHCGGFSCCGARVLECAGFSSCGTRAQLPLGMWNLLGPGDWTHVPWTGWWIPKPLDNQESPVQPHFN